MNKEREAFEKQGNIRIFVKQCLFDEQLNEYSSKSLHDYTLGFINGAWMAWQAAKAQAVPEGFILAPKKATYKMTIAGSNHAIKTHPVLNFGDLYKSMIEAQESTND